MFNRFGGVSPKPVGEGLHFFVPWLQVPYIYDIRTQPKVITTTTGTRDLQMVSLSLRLLYRPNESRLPVLHQTLGPDFAERVLPSIGNEVLKAVVARYDAESLLTQRDRVSQDIREHITQRAKNFDIELDDVAIVSSGYASVLGLLALLLVVGALLVLLCCYVAAAGSAAGVVSGMLLLTPSVLIVVFLLLMFSVLPLFSLWLCCAFGFPSLALLCDALDAAFYPPRPLFLLPAILCRTFWSRTKVYTMLTIYLSSCPLRLTRATARNSPGLSKRSRWRSKKVKE